MKDDDMTSRKLPSGATLSSVWIRFGVGIYLESGAHVRPKPLILWNLVEFDYFACSFLGNITVVRVDFGSASAHVFSSHLIMYRLFISLRAVHVNHYLETRQQSGSGPHGRHPLPLVSVYALLMTSKRVLRTGWVERDLNRCSLSETT